MMLKVNQHANRSLRSIEFVYADRLNWFRLRHPVFGSLYLF